MNCNHIIAGYQARSRAKVANATDQLIHAIARAYKYAESEGEAGYLAGKFVLAAFNPTRNKNKLNASQNGDAFFTLNKLLARLSKAVPEYWRNELEDEDIDQIKAMAQRLRDLTTRHYLYIFVRQDLCAEQQAVQAAHATFVAGAAIRADFAGNNARAKPFNPNTTHFVLIGVPDLGALAHAFSVTAKAGIETHPFYESDIGDELTAFTTGIVTQENRHVFREYGLLKFGDENGTSN